MSQSQFLLIDQSSDDSDESNDSFRIIDADDDDSVCSLTKVCFIKLLDSKNPPVLLRTPELLRAIQILYVRFTEKFVIKINLDSIRDNFLPYAEFLVEMKNWNRDGHLLFQNHYFIYPNCLVIMTHDGWCNLMLLINDLYPNFFIGLENG